MERRRTTTLGVALAGAVVLAGGAYALGAQKDDGKAAAYGPRSEGYGYGFGPGGRGGPGRPGGPMMEQRLDDLATKLGVSPDKLRAALEKLRPGPGPGPGRPGDKRDEIAQALATALGIPVSKVQDAFSQVRPKRARRARGGPPPGGPGGPPPGGPGGPGGRPPRMRGGEGPPVDRLAKLLGVDPAKLRTALQDIRQKKRDEFAQKLADELGIPVQKVKDALPDKPGP